MTAFSRAAFRQGARASLPLLAGLVPFGLVAGVMAQGQGLSIAEAGLMSALCYAGSAQLLALGHWSVPAPVLAATFAAFVVNLRLALMGPVLAPWLDRLRGWRLWGTLFMMADQNWALSVEHMRRGDGDGGFLFGSGLVMWVMWVLTTLAGHVLGGMVRPPPGHPLFFAALAVFIALLVPMWRGRADLLPWLVAAAVSALAARVVPGSWAYRGWRACGRLRRGTPGPADGAGVSFDPWTVAAILGMALATYASRGGGYWLFRQIRPSRGVQTMLGYIPGALFVSYVVPAIAAGALPQWVGAAAALGLMLAAGNLSLAILGGTAACWAVWAWQ